MKEKVKDLDPVLREILRDLMKRSGLKPVIMSEAPVIEIQNLIDWKLATNEERLKYAELRMPKGTIIESVYGTKHTIQFDFLIQCNSIHTGSASGSACIYSYPINRWAEIISRPDEKEETKEPEFQPGEMVSANAYKDLPEDMWITSEPLYFVGKDKAGLFVVENMNGMLKRYYGVRKIQPDPEKEIKAKVKILIEENFRRKDGPETPLQIVSFERGRLESMLIEALKTEVK